MKSSMPFKTKRRKLAASKHRVRVDTQGIVSYTAIPQTTDNEKFKVDTNYKSAPGIKNELLRIALLASLIIGLQLALKFSSISIFR